MCVCKILRNNFIAAPSRRPTVSSCNKIISLGDPEFTYSVLLEPRNCDVRDHYTWKKGWHPFRLTLWWESRLGTHVRTSSPHTNHREPCAEYLLLISPVVRKRRVRSVRFLSMFLFLFLRLLCGLDRALVSIEQWNEKVGLLLFLRAHRLDDNRRTG